MIEIEKGRIENIWENEKRNGEPYWVVAINGERYSAFDEELIRNLRAGDDVEYDWKKAGKYKNLAALSRVESDGAPAGKGNQVSGVRLSCLRSATELLAHCELDDDRRGDTALELARRFEGYVCGEQ